MKIVLVVFLLLIAGAGVFLLKDQVFPDLSEEEKAQKVQAKKDNKTIEAMTEVAHETMFVDMPPLKISVLKESKPVLLVSYMITLEVADEDTKKMVEQKLPLIHSTYIRYLHMMASIQGGSRLNKVEFLTGKLLELTHVELGMDKIHNILLRAYFEKNLLSQTDTPEASSVQAA